MWCLCHSRRASRASSRSTQQSGVQVTTEPADTPCKKKTKKYTHTHTHILTVNTPTELKHIKWFYSLQLWAQDVYQLLPDSCVGLPAVNCASDSPLLLLIVSISVPAEEWHGFRQAQAIDLQLVPDRPGAKEGEESVWSLLGPPRLSVWILEELRVLLVIVVLSTGLLWFKIDRLHKAGAHKTKKKIIFYVVNIDFRNIFKV